MKNQRRRQHQKTNPTHWWIIGGGIIALLIFGVILLTRNDTPASTLPNEVSVAEAKLMQSEGAFVLDVREPDEWSQGHIPGAELIPLGELESRLAELPKDQEIGFRKAQCYRARAGTSGRVNLIIDKSKVSGQYRLMIVALAYRRRSLPLAWSWVDGVRGHSSVDQQLALLRALQAMVPDAVKVSLVGDTEFGNPALLAQLEAWGWDYALRQSLL